MTPMPPACAMAIAISASVTVSMAEAMIGMLTAIERVIRERISASAGITSDRPGWISTSSNVSASRKAPLFTAPLFLSAIANSVDPKGITLRLPKGDKTPSARGLLARLHGPLLGWHGPIAREAGDS